MIVYTGSIEDAHELIQFFRREVGKLKTLRKLHRMEAIELLDLASYPK